MSESTATPIASNSELYPLKLAASSSQQVQTLLNGVYTLYFDDKVSLAYQDYQLLLRLVSADEIKEIITLNPWLEMLHDDVKNIKYLYNTLENDVNWTEVENSKGVRVLYRQEPSSGMYSISVHTDMYISMFNCVNVANESELLSETMTLIKIEASVLRQLTKFAQLLYFKVGLYWPFEDRDVVFQGRGIDMLDHRTVVVVAKPDLSSKIMSKSEPTTLPLTDDAIRADWESKYPGTPYKDTPSGTTRMGMGLCGGLIRAIGPNHVLLSGVFNVDPRMAVVPVSLINFMSKTLAHMGMRVVRTQMMAVIGSVFETRTKAKRWFYDEIAVRVCSLWQRQRHHAQTTNTTSRLYAYYTADPEAASFTALLCKHLKGETETQTVGCSLRSPFDSDGHNLTLEEDAVNTLLKANTEVAVADVLNGAHSESVESTLALYNSSFTHNNTLGLDYLNPVNHTVIGKYMIKSPIYLFYWMDSDIYYADTVSVRQPDSMFSKYWVEIFIVARVDGVYLVNMKDYAKMKKLFSEYMSVLGRYKFTYDDMITKDDGSVSINHTTLNALENALKAEYERLLVLCKQQGQFIAREIMHLATAITLNADDKHSLRLCLNSSVKQVASIAVYNNIVSELTERGVNLYPVLANITAQMKANIETSADMQPLLPMDIYQSITAEDGSMLARESLDIGSVLKRWIDQTNTLDSRSNNSNCTATATCADITKTFKAVSGSMPYTESKKCTNEQLLASQQYYFKDTGFSVQTVVMTTILCFANADTTVSEPLYLLKADAGSNDSMTLYVNNSYKRPVWVWALNQY